MKKKDSQKRGGGGNDRNAQYIPLHYVEHTRYIYTGTDKSGRNAAAIARAKAKFEIEEILLDHGKVRPNSKNQDDQEHKERDELHVEDASIQFLQEVLQPHQVLIHLHK